ncbi:hypothetical protein VNO77_28395 [Canavalia gladiata]|uniref:Uncharacterized protein n=1 Tax=Canavalia gladiata TaxID=3824 RepID=A0AAN9KVH0_CANGL
MSSISKAPSSKNMNTECESSDESGWTKYFEDFSNSHNIEDHNCYISSSAVHTSSSSLISDAASLPTAKTLNNCTQAQKYGNGTSFKQREKIKTTLFDEALEDTASSPVNTSPKEKGNTSGERIENKDLCFNGRDSDHTELKKKGLRLVSLSMIVKYLC